LYLSSNIIKQIKSRKMRWAEHVAHIGEEKKCTKVLVGKPKADHSGNGMDGIKMDLGEIDWGGRRRIHLADIGTGGRLL
jgi:hypothetical protein